MPDLMTVADFIEETSEDFKSPTTSTFTKKMSSCRQTIGSLEDNLDYDRDGLTKMKKALKTIYNGGNAHVDNELYLSKVLEKLGTNAMNRDQEPDIGAAFIKFSIVTKELSALMKTLMQNLNNVVMFPLDNILKGELKGVKGDLKKPFDKAWREYDSKMNKFEKEKKSSKEATASGKSELSPEELDKEKKMFQLQMIDYLLKANDIKTKKGVELLQHLVDYYHAQTCYFQDGLKTIEHFNGYIHELSTKISGIKTKQDEERKKLIELKNVLKSSAPFLETGKDSSSGLLNNVSAMNDKNGDFHHHRSSSAKEKSASGVYNLHQLQGNKSYGCSKSGFLLKKSEGKMKVKIWQKRKIEVKEEGFLLIFHSDENKEPTKVNLLTCQVKVIPDEKKCFNLISCNRTYHFQTEDENETEAWTSVLINCKEGALKKEFDSNNHCNSLNATSSSAANNTDKNNSLHELRTSIIKSIRSLPGNDKCVDCNSTKDATWLSTNFGVIVCIECSGIHRDLGVHISRIQSLTLDNIGTSQLLIARIMSNHSFNDIMEATLRHQSHKPTVNSSMEDRYEYIRAKYIDRKFVLRSCNGIINDLKSDLEHSINSRHLYSLLQAFGEGADLSWILPSLSKSGETSLHLAIKQEDGNSLHIIDFLIQNSKGVTLIDSVTKDGSTPLHYCVEYDQPEAMKLLLKSGANPKKIDSKGKTPLDLATELKRAHLVDLLEHSLKNRKSLFENVNIDWNLVMAEDASTDFSDDDVTDEKQTDRNGTTRSMRPSSVVGSESPSSLSSDSFRNREASMRRSSAGNPNTSQGLFRIGGSFKKKSSSASKSVSKSAAEDSSGSSGHHALAAVHANQSIGNIYSHMRTPSDSATPVYAQLIQNSSSHRNSGHWRNRSVDLVSSNHATTPLTSMTRNNHGPSQLHNNNTMSSASTTSDNNKSLSSSKTPPGTLNGIPTTVAYNSLQRPRCPPPPLPPPHLQSTPTSRISNNDQSILASSIMYTEPPVKENANRLSSASIPVPVPPPRKYYFQRPDLALTAGKLLKCRALYDCDADRDDELSFKEGEVILILSDKTEDEDWMEGAVEGDLSRRGLFPASFVQIIP